MKTSILERQTPNQTKAAIKSDRFLRRVDLIADKFGLNIPQIIKLEELETFPENTFASDLVKFYCCENLQPFTTGPRRKQIHDSVHVLTGYRTDPIGEAEVQAFLLGSHFRLIHFVIGINVLVLFDSNLNLGVAREKLWKAYLRGRNSTFELDSWQPELCWHLPLVQVQSQLRISHT